jgi:hypothetical protein
MKGAESGDLKKALRVGAGLSQSQHLPARSRVGVAESRVFLYDYRIQFWTNTQIKLNDLMGS